MNVLVVYGEPRRLPAMTFLLRGAREELGGRSEREVIRLYVEQYLP